MKSKKRSVPEYYDSLDAPVSVWQKVHETSDLSWLLLKRIKPNEKLRAFLQNAWDKIYNEYLAEFGLSENFISMKQKEIEIAEIELQLILSGDRTLIPFIKIEKEVLEKMKAGKSKIGFMESKIAIENRFKFQINMRSTSIREFYSYLKHLK